MISIEIEIVDDMEERRVRVDDKELDGKEGKFWNDFSRRFVGFISGVPVVGFVGH